MTCLLLWQSGGAAFAEPTAESGGELKQLSVEELMNVEVTSVAREPQKLLQAAASIQVITQRTFAARAPRSIPEALRLADNLEVAQINAHDWAISARGFNANLANKLLVLIDGRAVYTPLYGGVLWDVQDYLLEDIDRIEVISGPGGTLWGANAVNGVINIVTKAATDTQGTVRLSGAGATSREEQAGARYGAELAPDVSLRVYGKYTNYGDEVTSTGANAEDSWHMGRGGFRVDAQSSPQDRFTCRATSTTAPKTTATTATRGARAAISSVAGLTRARDGASMSLQLYYDHTYLSQPFAASPANPPFYSGFPAASLTDNLDTYDLDFQYHFAWGVRQQLTWGLGYRATHEADFDLSVVRFSPPVLDQALYSGFLQDEILLAPSVYLTLGSKLEHNDYTGYELEPSGRLQWNVDSATTAVGGRFPRGSHALALRPRPARAERP